MGELLAGALALDALRRRQGMNCIKIGLPGKSILRDYFQENMTSRRPFLLLRISFMGRPIFIQLLQGDRRGPGGHPPLHGALHRGEDGVRQVRLKQRCHDYGPGSGVRFSDLGQFWIQIWIL